MPKNNVTGNLRLQYICLLGLLLLVGCGGYNSLHGAIQSEWDTPIKILNMDKKHGTVIFLDKTQYVFNTFSMEDGKFKYSTDGEEGISFNGPFLLRANNRKSVGNVIWGVLRDNAFKVKITYINVKDPSNKGVIEIRVKNKTFIGYPKLDFLVKRSMFTVIGILL